MVDYKSFTNSELEDEMERLKNEYETAQTITLNNYQLMIQLAELYHQAEELLNVRTGKKKEG